MHMESKHIYFSSLKLKRNEKSLVFHYLAYVVFSPKLVE